MPEYFKKEMKGAADLRVRPSDATQNAAQSSRLVIRGKRHPNPPTPLTAAAEFPESVTEHTELLSFSKGRWGYRLHPIANQSAHPKVAHIDWLGFSFLPPPGTSLDWMFGEIERLTTLKTEPPRTKGWNGYLYSARLGRHGIIAWGGKYQKGTVHVELNGTGCSYVEDWRSLSAWGNALDAKVTRIDLAHDDFEGEICNIDQIIAWYHAKGFNCGGRDAKLKHAGDWTHGTDGRTLYVGTRGNKLLRCYEKGKQLGRANSPWFRVELELRNKNRVIPWETLEVPGQYLAGSYPCLSFLSAHQSKIKTCQNGAELSVDTMTHHASRLSGKAINVLMQVHGENADAVVEKLRREGIPKRLLPYEIGLQRLGDKDENS